MDSPFCKVAGSLSPEYHAALECLGSLVQRVQGLQDTIHDRNGLGTHQQEEKVLPQPNAYPLA